MVNKMAGNTGKFRSYIWDPILIISQIVAIQFTFYFFLGAWILSVDKISGRFVAVNQIFDGRVSLDSFAKLWPTTKVAYTDMFTNLQNQVLFDEDMLETENLETKLSNGK